MNAGPQLNEVRGLPQMSLEELLSVKVSVATRTESTVLEAPSIVSVFTADDFRRMGARDLRDVLRTVPGFELGIRSQLGYTEFGVRGVITDNTEKVRILVDGLPVNENLEGSGTIIFGDMSLDNVQQIEIIRGPGSALYGTNAFLGVISILTKDASNSGGATTVSARGGSFNTREGSVLSGWSGGRFRISAYLHYLDTDGPAPSVAQDALQVLAGPPDFSALNRGISLAGTPAGHIHAFRRQLSAQVKLDYQGLTFNGVFTNAHKGPYLGTYFAVNEHSDAHPSQAQGTLSYTLRPAEDWVIEPRLYALHYIADNRWNDAPNGYRMPDGQGGTVDYTQGSYEINRATQQTRGAEVKATWSPAGPHRVILGGSLEEQKLYALTNFANVPGFGLDRMVPTPSIMRKEPVRTLSSAYLQDQWAPAQAFALTTGLRMDRYNDAGTSITPRLAAVWRPDPAWHVKLLYGEAFRAPTFVESYLFAANGFIQGREDVKPETIRTGEFEVGRRLGSAALWRVVFFENRITNLLNLVPVPGGLRYQNLPEVTTVKGIETELTLTLSSTLSGYVNASGQSGRNGATGETLVGMANWRGNLGLNAAFSDRLNLHAALGVVGPRLRGTGDARPDLRGYRTVDLALTFTPVPALDLSLSAHNLFDADQRFPSVSVPLPGDLPWEGRSIQAGLSWHF
ncbi:TonB-dependent receptor plug domain-containing protein [Geothrix limicola]|uniref:TonB-dependent receptor plug domain-containing protein n=1 Tax=Geothrix limicola TaxID=2927978 RepID=UPI00255386B9|nr:TonB-dependent receptor [Geothrix limicola]